MWPFTQKTVKHVITHEFNQRDRERLESLEMHLVATFDELQSLSMQLSENQKLQDELLGRLEEDDNGGLQAA